MLLGNSCFIYFQLSTEPHSGYIIKSISLKGPDNLFDKVIVVCPNIVSCFNEVHHMLLWVSLTIKLLKFWSLITCRHFQDINLVVYDLAYVNQYFVKNLYLSLTVPMMRSLIWLIRIIPSEETWISLAHSTCFERPSTVSCTCGRFPGIYDLILHPSCLQPYKLT